ncbi:MAG: hypothetical protein RL213_1528 [Bacteroidota bacterium]|jgi:hypothetical protein
MLKKYPTEAFDHLVAAVRDKDESAQEWLASNGYPELYHFLDAIEDVEVSFRWLLDNGFRHFAAVVDGLSGKDQAKAWLIRSGYPALAAFIEACDGSAQAVKFLVNAGEKGWVLVAREINAREKKKQKNFFWNFLNFGNPFR